MSPKFIILLIAAVFPALAVGFPPLACQNGRPPVSIFLENCPTAPCHITQGDLVSFQVDWIASAASNNLNLEVLVHAFGSTIPVDTEIQVCDVLAAGSCPVVAGQALVATGSYFVNNNLQLAGDVQLELTVRYDNGDISACTLIDLLLH